jgi:hypothetical protein
MTAVPRHLASSMGLTLTAGATQYTTKAKELVDTKTQTQNEAPAVKEPTMHTLNLQGVVGYNGNGSDNRSVRRRSLLISCFDLLHVGAGMVRGGLLLRPDDNTLIYPLGSTVVLRNLVNNTQTFLRKNGHDRSVSCIALSPSGRLLASGQVTHMGFSAVAIIWNLDTGEALHRLTLHKGAVQDLAFSPDEKYLATLGGRDDNKLVIWDVVRGALRCAALCCAVLCCAAWR